MARSPSIRSLLKDLEPDELREVIVELSKLNKKNKQFLRIFLQSSDAVNLDAIVEEAKKKIHKYLYGRSTFPKVDLANARKTVNEYKKVLKVYPAQIAELKLYYVELGTEMTNEFGDMYEGFYSSMESMFNSFSKDIIKHPEYFEQFEIRIHELESACQDIGWGYSYAMNDMIFELEEVVKISRNT